MQNKGAIWFFTAVLALACLYQISFSFITSNVESKAADAAKMKLDSLERNGTEGFLVIDEKNYPYLTGSDSAAVLRVLENRELERVSNKEVFFGLTYQQCKSSELNLGLDLKGGMSVTLEVSIPSVVKTLSGKSTNPKFTVPFEKAQVAYAKDAGDFIAIFLEEFEKENDKDFPMALIFFQGNQSLFNSDMSNAEVVEVLRNEAIEAVNGTEIKIAERINQFGVSQPSIQKQAVTGRILIELPGVKDKVRVRKQLQSTANLEFWETYSLTDIQFELLAADQAVKTENDLLEGKTEEKVEEIVPIAEVDRSDSLNSDAIVLETENVVDSLNYQDSTVEETIDLANIEDIASDSTSIDSTGLDLAQEARPLLDLLTANGQLFPTSATVGVVSVSDTSKVNRYLRRSAVKAAFSGKPDLALMWNVKENIDPDSHHPNGTINLVAIKKTSTGKAELDGSYVSNARQDYDPYSSQIVVIMDMNFEGALKWKTMTEQNLQKQVAVTMDGLVYSAPVVQGVISGGNTQISGNFTLEEGQDLAKILKAGSLPAKATILDETVVGASLGSSNISSGLTSFGIALLVVLLYMIFYYGKAGLVSNVALLANIFFLIGMLASLQASLTLPGIAGIVLTIGMSVDANVLIYERIREELRSGKSKDQSITDGYKKAYAAIFDANITTLLTAVVLATFGSGPIKGFATTLIIGIFTSLFSAIVITRLIFSGLLDRKKEISFSTKTTENLFVNSAIAFIARRKLFYVISGLVVIGGAISLSQKGLDYGVEFTGGRSYVVKFEDKVDYEKLKETLGVVFTEDDLEQKPEVKLITDNYHAKITTKYKAEDRSPESNDIVDAKLDEGLTVFGNAYEVQESRSVDSSISDYFVSSSLSAVFFSLIIIFLYIFIRFRKWQYGVGALIAMTHDVVVVLSLFSIFYGILPFSMEIDQAFIAAILTVVGYSINDTVVVFDRIREYLGIHTKKDHKEVINAALNSTLSRTVNTSLSTFLVLFAIFIFGGESIKGFTFALMIGVIVGTYSSLFIATPSVVDFTKKVKAPEKA